MSSLSIEADPDTDYGFATDYDKLCYSIHSLAATAALNNIRKYVSDFYPRDTSLQESSLIRFLESLPIFEPLTTEQTIDLLYSIRNNAITHHYICHEWDQIKCFLRLLSCRGYPIYINIVNEIDQCITTIKFAKFTIVKTYLDDFDEFEYSINTNYARLRLLLSGDVEENPGPTSHSKMVSEDNERLQRRQLKELQREIERLKKNQKRQQNFLQRQLEKEKRDRNKKRKDCADQKRHAQTLVTETVNKLADDVKSTFNPGHLAEIAKASGLLAANVVLPGSGTAVATASAGAKINAALNKLTPSISTLQELLSNLTQSSRDLRNLFAIPTEYDFISILVSLVSILNDLKNKSLLLVTMHCTNLARLLGVSLTSLISLIPSFSNDTVSFSEPSPTDDPQPSTSRSSQSLTSDLLEQAKNSPELLPFAGFLAFFCGIFSLLCTGTIPTPGEMVKHFSCVGRASSGFKAVKDVFNWMYDYIAELYYTKVYGMSASDYHSAKVFPELANLIAASRIIEKLEKPNVDRCVEIANQILTVNSQLRDYNLDAVKTNSRMTTSLITITLNRIKEQVSWAEHCPARHGTIRDQPFSLYLYGHPGVGKSIATEVLKARIFKKYLSDSTIAYDHCSFPRRAKNEYWEGYTGQPIIILDDFGNLKDSQMKPVEEYEELEYMVNTAQYPLKMAEIKSKGVTNFTSDYIIASSNQKYPEIKSLVDPGAIFRRFHVWAEVTIDPSYGTPTGKDEQGNSYYQFSKTNTAKAKGVAVDALSPLCTEHYRFSCYKVIHNKQKNIAEVIPVQGKTNLTFENFWDYYVEENDKAKNEGKLLEEAIREQAGITIKPKTDKEKEIISDFDKIFSPEKFIDAIAQDNLPFVDAETDPLDTTQDLARIISEMFTTKETAHKIALEFRKVKEEVEAEFTTAFSKLRTLPQIASNGLLKIAEFVLSLLSSTTTNIIQYLPSVPTTTLFSGLVATMTAACGAWYAGLFCSPAIHNTTHWCKFNSSPSNSNTPCTTCSSCKIMQYPKHGNMLDHFMERTGVKSVRKDLLELGMPRETLEDIREEVRLTLQRPTAQSTPRQCQILRYAHQNFTPTTKEHALEILNSTCWSNCEICDEVTTYQYDYLNADSCIDAAMRALSITPFAQRVYDSQPRVPRNRPCAQRVYSSDPRMPKTQRLAHGLIECKTDMEIGAVKYAQRDIVRVEQTTSVLLSNSVWIQAVDKEGRCCRSNGVFLVGRTMITTAHTVLNPPHIHPIEHIIISNPYATSEAIKVPIDQCKISQTFQLDGSPVDLALISFPPVVPNRPKILSKFLNANDIDKLMEGSLTFSGFHQVNGKSIVQEKYTDHFSVTTKNTSYYLHEPNTCPKSSGHCVCPISIGNHIDYDLHTVSGMCGALLSISNNLIHTKLIGFHVAGGKDVMALGALTTRQFLERALTAHIEKFNIPQSYLIDGRLPYSQSWVDSEVKVSLLDHGDCLNVGTAPAPAAPSQTTLSPSLIFDKVQEHITKPAHLRPAYVEGEGIVDPMLKGIKKIMGGQIYLDPDLLEAAANDVFQGLGPPETGRGVVHSYTEAIVGVDGDPYKRPINRTTSPGYPYNLNNKTKGKTAWLGTDETYIVDHPELKRDVEKLLEDSRNGIRGSAISIATLKDEKRPIAKVDACKTRVFEACPQHLVIAIRQYFLDFAAHVMRNRIGNGIAVGINPYSLEWTKLAHHLQKQGDFMIAGDFSNFDGSLLMQVLVKIMEKINEWYDDGEEAALIRAALWDHICNADILVRGEVIRKTHSQPSGNPLTVIINSLFNGIVMRIAYLLLKKEQGLPQICDYRNYVTEIIYGDDDIKSVNVAIISWFNQITLTKALASIGLTYTDETKTGQVHRYKPLVDVAFLKRKFVIQQDGTFMAPMDLENVLEITNWIRGKAKRAATLENCKQVLMELSLHPRHVYEYWSNFMRRELHQVGLNLLVPTYYEQMEEYKYNRDMYSRQEYVPLW